MIDNLEEAVSYIKELPKIDVKPGLSRVNHLLDSLGNPEKDFRAIHIAGSNGKGSVLALLSSVLGKLIKLGAFVSPPLVEFSDRIKVNDKNIDAESITLGIKKLVAPIEQLKDQENTPTLFEAATALAAWYFSEQNVELALLEVGLGGRYDATKPVGNSIMSIVTSVNLEHQNVLGDTLEQIGGEIAGIAFPNTPLILGPDEHINMNIFERECDKQNCKLIPTDEVTEVKLTDFDWHHSRFKVRKTNLSGLTGERIRLNLLGTYQEFNLSTAITALGELEKKGFLINKKNVIEGLQDVTWPGRFQILTTNPHVILDGAHNPAAVSLLGKELDRYQLLMPEDCQIILLFSALRDKPIEQMLREFIPHIDRLILTQINHQRAASISYLDKIAKKLDVNYEGIPEPREAFSKVLMEADSKDMICVSGSLYLVREALIHGFKKED